MRKPISFVLALLLSLLAGIALGNYLSRAGILYCHEARPFALPIPDQDNATLVTLPPRRYVVFRFPHNKDWYMTVSPSEELTRATHWAMANGVGQPILIAWFYADTGAVRRVEMPREGGYTGDRIPEGRLD